MAALFQQVASHLYGCDAVEGVKPKYRTRKGAGNRIYFSPLLDQIMVSSGKPLLITEGEKCTDSANHHGFPSIGLAGQTHEGPEWCSGRTKGDQLQDGRQILICFDSDLTTNPSVWMQRFSLQHGLILLPLNNEARSLFVQSVRTERRQKRHR